MTTLKQPIKVDGLELKECLEQSPQPQSLTLAKRKYLKSGQNRKIKEGRQNDIERKGTYKLY